MATRPKSLQWTDILRDCDKWSDVMERCLPVLPFYVHENSGMYSTIMPDSEFGLRTAKLVDWCRVMTKIDGNPLVVMMAELRDPWQHPLDEGALKTLADDCRLILARLREEGTDNAPDQDGPPDEIVAELSALHRRLLGFLWSNPVAKRGSVVAAGWPTKIVEAASATRELQRLNTRLMDLSNGSLSLDSKGEYVKLVRPDK